MSSEKKRIYSIILIIACILTVAFIWGNSLLDSSSSTKVSSGLLNRIKPFLKTLKLYAEDDLLLRKFAHFSEFGALGAELCLLFLLNTSFNFQTFVNCAFIALLVGVTDETIQIFTGRHSAVPDVIIDFVGSVIGVSIVYLIVRAVIRHREKKRT